MIIEIKTRSKEEAIDITDIINSHIEKNEKQNKNSKFCFLFLLHTTASLLINEGFDKNLIKDIFDQLSLIVPEKDYMHNRIDNNASSHIKSCLLNTQLLIPVHNKRLFLGEYQRVFLLEFDGPRTRKIFFELL
ncbi:MAG: secondary thiamine-phosphate synthase enzyme YjbQ [Candidatus Woesearchaeota archaeon]